MASPSYTSPPGPGYTSPSYRSVTELLADGVNQFTRLLRTEAQLARTEVSEKIGQVAAGLGMIIGGTVLLIPAVVILLQAAVVALIDSGFTALWSAVIVGGAAFVIGLILVLVGSNRLKAKTLVPTRTMDQLQRDASVAKQTVSSSHDATQRAA